jgi:hypothetical protein
MVPTGDPVKDGDRETPNLDGIMKEVKRLKKAEEILFSIYAELSPYTNHLKPETLRQMNDFYGFDDSE